MILLDVKVNGCAVVMLLDTGANVTLFRKADAYEQRVFSSTWIMQVKEPPFPVTRLTRTLPYNTSVGLSQVVAYMRTILAFPLLMQSGTTKACPFDGTWIIDSDHARGALGEA